MRIYVTIRVNKALPLQTSHRQILAVIIPARGSLVSTSQRTHQIQMFSHSDPGVHFICGLSDVDAVVNEAAELMCKLSSEDCEGVWFKEGRKVSGLGRVLRRKLLMEPSCFISVMSDGFIPSRCLLTDLSRWPVLHHQGRCRPQTNHNRVQRGAFWEIPLRGRRSEDRGNDQRQRLDDIPVMKRDTLVYENLDGLFV